MEKRIDNKQYKHCGTGTELIEEREEFEIEDDNGEYEGRWTSPVKCSLNGRTFIILALAGVILCGAAAAAYISKSSLKRPKVFRIIWRGDSAPSILTLITQKNRRVTFHLSSSNNTFGALTSLADFDTGLLFSIRLGTCFVRSLNETDLQSQKAIEQAADQTVSQKEGSSMSPRLAEDWGWSTDELLPDQRVNEIVGMRIEGCRDKRKIVLMKKTDDQRRDDPGCDCETICFPNYSFLSSNSTKLLTIGNKDCIWF
jgi:hypothetical protein